MISLLLLVFGKNISFAEEHPTLAIGAKAPSFSLKGIDGKTYSLTSFSRYKILVIIFTCNHCPTAQAYEERIIHSTKDYSAKGVAVVAVSPNDPKSIRLDELGYTDMSDTYAEMKLRAKQKKFNFPYLYDGDKQAMDKSLWTCYNTSCFYF
jgi:hypothetical protein